MELFSSFWVKSDTKHSLWLRETFLHSFHEKKVVFLFFFLNNELSACSRYLNNCAIEQTSANPWERILQALTVPSGRRDRGTGPHLDASVSGMIDS